MIPKQDRSPVRTPAHIEQKYNLNTDFSAIEKMASAANRNAEQARSVANDAAKQIKTVSEQQASLSKDIALLDKRIEELENSQLPNGDEVSY